MLDKAPVPHPSGLWRMSLKPIGASTTALAMSAQLSLFIELNGTIDIDPLTALGIAQFI